MYSSIARRKRKGGHDITVTTSAVMHFVGFLPLPQHHPKGYLSETDTILQAFFESRKKL